jgi:hypothetical protein
LTRAAADSYTVIIARNPIRARGDAIAAERTNDIPMHPSPTDHSAPAAAAGHALFSAAELESLHSADRQAAMHVVMLMTGIFLTGVVLYLSICFIVAS